MPPDNAEEWLARARSNLVQARTLQSGVYLEDLCFQAQQASEKALKALLLLRKGSFPYTHDLAYLIGLVEDTEWLPEGIREAARLTDYAVEARYPGIYEPVEQGEYEEALELAERIVRWVEGEATDEPESTQTPDRP